MEEPATKYTIKEIVDELNYLEKEITKITPFKIDERTKEIVGYYLNNSKKYDDEIGIRAQLDEIGFALLQREINS